MTEAQKRAIEVLARAAYEAARRGEYAEPRIVPEQPPPPPVVPPDERAA